MLPKSTYVRSPLPCGRGGGSEGSRRAVMQTMKTASALDRIARFKRTMRINSIAALIPRRTPIEINHVPYSTNPHAPVIVSLAIWAMAHSNFPLMTKSGGLFRFDFRSMSHAGSVAMARRSWRSILRNPTAPA